MKKIHFSLSILLLTTTTVLSQEYSITPWANGKKAAVTITFDDNTIGQFLHAVPAMNARDIRATFFINAKTMDWNLAQEAISTGHEIGNHTFSHANLLDLDTVAIRLEIKNGADIIATQVPGQRYISFAYPGGQGRGSTPKDDTVRMLVKQYHINGRGIRTAGFNIGNKGFDLYDEYKNPLYDDYYYQTGTFSINQNTSNADFKNTLHNAIAAGGWFSPLYHGIEIGGISVVPIDKFISQMQLLKDREDDLWITTFGEATCYHKERQAATLKEMDVNEKQWVLQLSDTLDNNIYREPLTIRLFVADTLRIKNIVQNDIHLPMIEDGDTVQFNAVPDGGDIIINRELPLPAAPHTFLAEALSGTEILLTWLHEFPHATKFSVERKWNDEESGEITSLTYFEEGVVTYKDTGLKPNTFYYYRIMAINDAGASDWTAHILVKTPDDTCDTPAELSSDNISHNTATISWEETAGARGYQISYQLSVGSGSEGTFISVENPAVDLHDLMPDSEYEWTVRAVCDGLSTSEPSSKVFFKTLADPTITHIEKIKELTFDIFPIPSPGDVNFRINGLPDRNITLIIYNYLGEELLRSQGLGQIKSTVDFRNFGGKMFIAQLSSEEGTVTKKIILK